MANVKVTSARPIYNGMPVTFKAPCDCTAVSGLTVAYEGESYTFGFKDAHNNPLAGLGNLFLRGALVKVILDTENNFAYLQNADTNAYIENTFAKKDFKTTAVIGTSWIGSAAPYTQSIAIDGVEAESVVEISLPSTATAAQVEAFQGLGLQDGGQVKGSITLRAFDTKNTIVIPVNVVIRDCNVADAGDVDVAFADGTLTLL